MGSRMGPNYACLFVGYMEERILSTYTGFIPQLYKRYIDDIVGAASRHRDELAGFITHVNLVPRASSLVWEWGGKRGPFPAPLPNQGKGSGNEVARMYPLSIPLCSLLTPFLKPRYLSWTSHSASQAAELVLPFTTKTPTAASIYITPLLILSTQKWYSLLPVLAPSPSLLRR